MRYLLILNLLFSFNLFSQIVPPPPVPKSDRPSSDCECMIEAEYPGGAEALFTDIYSNLTYPDSAKTNHIEGRVFIEFVVDTTGEVINLKLLKGIGHGCDEAALSAARQIKTWTPARLGCDLVQQRFKLPINFKLD